MPELVVLNVPHDVLSRIPCLATKTDEEAQRWLKVEPWKEDTPPFDNRRAVKLDPLSNGRGFSDRSRLIWRNATVTRGSTADASRILLPP